MNTDEYCASLGDWVLKSTVHCELSGDVLLGTVLRGVGELVVSNAGGRRVGGRRD